MVALVVAAAAVTALVAFAALILLASGVAVGRTARATASRRFDATTSGAADQPVTAAPALRGATATLPRNGRYVVVVETKDQRVHWTVDIADQSR